MNAKNAVSLGFAFSRRSRVPKRDFNGDLRNKKNKEYN